MAVYIFGEGKQSQGGPGQKGVSAVGFKILDNEGNYDINNKRLTNVAALESGKDAVTLAYTNTLYDEVITSLSDVESKLVRVEEDLDTLDVLRRDLREEVMSRLIYVESSTL